MGRKVDCRERWRTLVSAPVFLVVFPSKFGPLVSSEICSNRMSKTFDTCFGFVRGYHTHRPETTFAIMQFVKREFLFRLPTGLSAIVRLAVV